MFKMSALTVPGVFKSLKEIASTAGQSVALLLTVLTVESTKEDRDYQEAVSVVFYGRALE
jgi:hypothetical protein